MYYIGQRTCERNQRNVFFVPSLKKTIVICRSQIHLCNTYMFNIRLNPGLVPIILVTSPDKIATVVNCFEIYSDGCQHLYSLLENTVTSLRR